MWLQHHARQEIVLSLVVNIYICQGLIFQNQIISQWCINSICILYYSISSGGFPSFFIYLIGTITWRVILNITVYTLSLWLCLSTSKGIGIAIRNEGTLNFYDSTSFPFPRIFPLSLDMGYLIASLKTLVVEIILSRTDMQICNNNLQDLLWLIQASRMANTVTAKSM